jgi:hypothetical protein
MMEAIMKSFKEYLTESKKTYEFKVKIAGEIPKDFATNLKTALSAFQVENIKNAKRTPIQESPIDFPNVFFREVTVFDVELKYPCNSPMLAKIIHEHMGIDRKHVVVRTLGEEQESIINTQYMGGDEVTTSSNADEALLNTPYQPGSNQDMVGEQQKMGFLKGLEATKHGLEEYKGVNDQLFAGMPKSDDQKMQSSVTPNDSKISVTGHKSIKLSPVVADVKNGIGKGK